MSHIKKKIKSRIKIDIIPICKICGKELKTVSGLASHLSQKHKMSYSDYLLKFFNINLEKIEKEYQSLKIHLIRYILVN